MQTPSKVSIIIPVYNTEPWLVQCMDSVVSQTLQEIEIICVNDGSTDRSPEILRQYAANDSRIVIIDKANAGYGAAMNDGIDRASGEYIGIVEPDDFVPPEMFEVLYGKASENDLDFVKADFYRFTTNEDGTIEKTLNSLSVESEDYNKVFNPSRDPERLNYVMNTWSGIYKRAFLEEHHIRHNETPGASFQDTGFWFQTFIFGQRAMIIDIPLYRYRKDNPSSSVNNPNKVYTMNAEYDFIKDKLMENPEIWERFRNMYWFKKYYAYYTSLKRIAPKFKQDFVNRWSEEMKRGLLLEQYDETVFSSYDWNRIQMLIKNPERYYFEETGSIPNFTQKLMSSKLTVLLPFIPRRVKDLMVKILEHH